MSETFLNFGSREAPDQGFATDLADALRNTTWDTVGATFAINLLSLVLPLALMQVYDRIIPNIAINTLTLLSLGVAGALLHEAALHFLRAMTTGWSAARFEHLEGCRAVERILSARLAAFEQQGVGEHLENFSP